MANEKIDIYARVTQQIIDAIEKGAGTWEMPWHRNSGMPVNVESGRFYRGVNVPVLGRLHRRRAIQAPSSTPTSNGRRRTHKSARARRPPASCSGNSSTGPALKRLRL